MPGLAAKVVMSDELALKGGKSSKKAKQEEGAVVVKKEVVDKKKRKASDVSVENGASLSPSSAKKDKKKKAVKIEAGETAGAAAAATAQEEKKEAVNKLSVDNFRLSKEVKDLLKKKGIEALFPIQAQTFDLAFDGNDLIGRARTGQGKTLAFVLPIVESLKASNGVGKGKYGRAPSVLVLAPTRELAKQVHADFEYIGQAFGLSTVCVYGGAPFSPQESALRRGVDVVVGTPGRIKDHLERGNLNLRTLKFRVLDEADEMLNMGFVDDVELILGKFLHWRFLTVACYVIADKFQKSTKKTVDLVGTDRMKANSAVRHMLLPCRWQQRTQLIADVIKCYARGESRSIVFTETKHDADELAAALGSTLKARALHGDVAQSQREAILAGFRSGKFSVLVATDVAARGLDINDVTLVIQSEPPRDVETYIHRSGRTGRAGKEGVSVMLSTPKKEYMIGMIEHKAGVVFERVGAPQPADIARVAATEAVSSIESVPEEVIPLFHEAAQQLLDGGRTPLDVVAAALAKVSGHTDVKRGSLLSGHEDSTTLLFEADNTNVRTPTYVFSFLRRRLPEDAVNEVRRMNLLASGNGAAFDVPNRLVPDFLAAADTTNNNTNVSDHTSTHAVKITKPTSLPALTPKPEQRGSGGGGFQRQGNNSYGGGGGGGGRSNMARGMGGFNRNGVEKRSLGFGGSGGFSGPRKNTVTTF
eukprot:jgi/Chlat1/328/Chrsp1S00218